MSERQLRATERNAARLASEARPELWSSAAEGIGREGMVTVWDDKGGYLGCMGIETWRRQLTESAPSSAGPDAETLAATVRALVNDPNVRYDYPRETTEAADALSALVAMVEQLRRDLEGVHLALAEANVPRSAGIDEPLWSEQRRVRLLRERAEAAEALLARYRQALELIAEWKFDGEDHPAVRFVALEALQAGEGAIDALAASAPGTECTGAPDCPAAEHSEDCVAGWYASAPGTEEPA